jgi:hypothetical protein
MLLIFNLSVLVATTLLTFQTLESLSHLSPPSAKPRNHSANAPNPSTISNKKIPADMGRD